MTSTISGFNPDYVPQESDFASLNPTPDPLAGLPPVEFVRRVQHLQQSGQSWLPLQTLSALVGSGLSDSEIVQTAESMRQAALGTVTSQVLKPAVAGAQQGLNIGTQALQSASQYTSAASGGPGASNQTALNHQQNIVNQAKNKATQGDDGFKVFFDDPVLQKHPSAALALKQYLSGAVGPWPITDAHLGHIQQQLQIQGFGRDLKADGTWNPGWDAAQQSWKNQLFKSQLAGNKPGSLTLGHAVQALQALTPTSAWNALWGWVTQLPDGARNLLADVSGSVAGLGAIPWDIAAGNENPSRSAHGEVASAIQTVLGNHMTPNEAASDFEHHAARHILEDASNVIMLASTLGSVGRFADAIGEGAASLGTEAAYRGPGVIANSLSSQTLGNPAIPRAIAGGVTTAAATAAAGGTPLQIGLAGVGGAAAGGLSEINVFKNLPILGRTGPVIDALADADGLYYKARRLVAAPYQLQAVQAADTAFNSSLLLGAEARGLGQINQYVDPNSGFSNATQNTHALDGVNDALRNHLQFTALGTHIAPSLDDLMFAFSGRGAAALHNTPSAQFGAGVSSAIDSYRDFLGQTGVESAIENATGLSRAKLIKNAGGLENYTDFWTSQVLQHAIAHTVEDGRLRDLQSASLPTEEGLSDVSRLQDLQARTHEMWGHIQEDPSVAQRAVESLVAQGGGNELYRRIQRDITNGLIKPGTPGDIKQYMAAVNTAKSQLLPHVGALIPEVTTPAAATGIGSADNLPELFHGTSQRFSNDTVQEGAGSGAGNLLGPGFYSTDNLDVAKSYMGKGRGRESAVYRTQWTGTNPPRVLDAELPTSSALVSTIRDWWHTQTENDYSSFDITQEAHAKVVQALDDHAPLTHVIGSIREAIASSGDVTRSEANEMMVGLSDRIQSQGYDALRYSGGVRTGNQTHNAYVFLDESNVQAQHLGPITHTPADIGPNHVLLNAGTEPGQFGLARLDTLTRQEAYVKASDLQAKYNAYATRAGTDTALQIQPPGGLSDEQLSILVRPTIEEHVGLQRELGDALHQDFGVDARSMPQDMQGKIDAYKDFAGQLAVGVVAHPDAPPEVLDAVAKLRDLGYKPVTGTDIGHHLLPSPVTDVLTNPLSFQRRVAQHLGITPDIVDQKVIGQTQWTNMRQQIQAGIDSGRITLPPFETPDSILAYLSTDGVLDFGNRVKSSLRELFNTPRKVAEKEGYYNTLGQLDIERARAELEGAYQIRDATHNQITAALTDRERWAAQHPASAEADIPPMSKDSAEGIVNAVRNGYAAPPAWQLGASKLEDLFRASMGFAGKGVAYRAAAGAGLGAATGYAAGGDLQSAGAGALAGGTVAALGGDRLGYAMANLPNELIRLRNEARFELSPFFSFRRVAKTNVKMAAEGITPVLSPLDTMIGANTLAQDRATLERIRPSSEASLITDDADKYIKSQDLFGFYNPRNYEAYAAGQLARQGMSDDQISQTLTKVFEYGSSTERGRSALERSANFTFFPFSFDKTLYRNLGGYLLDKPAQRLLLTRAFAAYDEFNRNHMDGSNPLATSFYDRHLPLLTEVNNLNAFAGGISAGQPGGVNRPLLNLFLPQSWGATSGNYQTLQKFVPVVKDFSRIYNESLDQGSIVHSTFSNLARDIQGIPATYGNPAASTETKQQQLTDGFAMDRVWKQSLQKYTDYNAQSNSPDDKYKFPLSPEWGKYAGEPITNANIRELVHLRYPAYDPMGAISYATAQSRQFSQYLLDQKGTPLFSYISDFQKNANALGRLMNTGSAKNSDIAASTDNLRQAAVYIAQQDPAFYSLYNKNFRKILGPLEAVKNG